MPKVEDILELLENGRWQDLKEIGKKIQLQDLDITSVAKFLAQYNFIKLDKEGKKAKLDASTKDFLKKIRQLEGEEKL
ncbi:hypothetical protein IBX38_09210 [Candidatus Bathyarchaeota archaeon]|nr:hypothetical protein [Candidatus Bathyarchaeota archaeon]